jgi:hypothetical protein
VKSFPSDRPCSIPAATFSVAIIQSKQTASDIRVGVVSQKQEGEVRFANGLVHNQAAPIVESLGHRPRSCVSLAELCNAPPTNHSARMHHGKEPALNCLRCHYLALWFSRWMSDDCVLSVKIVKQVFLSNLHVTQDRLFTSRGLIVTLKIDSLRRAIAIIAKRDPAIVWKRCRHRVDDVPKLAAAGEFSQRDRVQASRKESLPDPPCSPALRPMDR